MLTKIREGAVDTQLRPEFLCGEPNFRTLAEAIACAIFISQGKRLHYVNHAAEAITGYAREELLSMNFWDLVYRFTKTYPNYPVVRASNFFHR